MTDLSLEGCCLLGTFEQGEILDLSIRTIGRFPAQIRWAQPGRAGARFIDRRSATATPVHSISGDTRGVAAIEYALLVALVALTLVVAFAGLGTAVGEQYEGISTAVELPDQTSYNQSAS